MRVNNVPSAGRYETFCGIKAGKEIFAVNRKMKDSDAWGQEVFELSPSSSKGNLMSRGELLTA